MFGVILFIVMFEQFGCSGYFVCFCLFDLQCYSDLDVYFVEVDIFQVFLQVVDCLLENQLLSVDQCSMLVVVLVGDVEFIVQLVEMIKFEYVCFIFVVLIDCYGIGCVMFCNCCVGIGGFFKCVLVWYLFDVDLLDDGVCQLLLVEFYVDIQQLVLIFVLDYSEDVCLQVLVDLLEKYLQDKFLLICCS